MASICVHRAPRTPPDSTPRHIRSRDGLQEDHRPATHGRAGPAFPFAAIHLARQSPFYETPGHILSRDGLQEDHRPATHSRAGPAFPFPAIHQARQSPFYETPGHIDSRDGINLCPSSDANPSRHRFRAHPLARWFAGRSPAGHGPATHGPQSLVSARALAFLQFIWHGNRHSTCLQDTLTCAMASICVHRATRTPPDSTPGHIRSRDDLPEESRPATDLPRTAMQALHSPFLQFI